MRSAALRAALVLAGLIALTWVQYEARLAPPGTVSLVLETALPIWLVVALVALAMSRRRWVLAGGVLVAVLPSVLAQFAAGQRHGLVAVLAIVAGLMLGPAGRREPGAAAALAAAVTAVGAASWWSATPARPEGVPAPSWTTLLGRVGTYVERAVGGLGPDTLPAPQTATLAVWCAIGIVVVAATISGRRRIAAAVPVGVVLLVAGCMALERWQGPVNPVAGAWLLAGTVAFTASRVHLPRRAEQRIVVPLTALVAWAWSASVAMQVRAVAIDDAVPASWSRWRDWASATGGATASVLLPVTVLAGLAVATAAWWAGGRSGDRRGVNVVGYHTITGGLGERTRELVASLRTVGVPVAEYDVAVDSERDREPLPIPDRRYDTTVAVVPAFEVPHVAEAHPDLFSGRRLVAGYWFWELDRMPPSHRAGLELVDEVWAPSRFVRDAYRPVTLRPVRHVPLRIPEPEVAHLDRGDLGIRGDAFVLLVSFSHLSVMERKNPIGAIEAFTRAFPPGAEGADLARLIVKSINADRRPDDAARLRDAAAGDDRIEIRDGRIEHRELMALVRASDAFVSLHRSEGLGLQIADAMWLGTPVIATDCGGSRDLIDVGTAEIVPWRPTPVERGDGAYPETFTWADPDLDAAARAMRRLAADPDRRYQLAEAARRRIAAQPDRAQVGHTLAKLTRCPARRSATPPAP